MFPFGSLLILIVIPSICKGLRKNTCDVVPKDLHIEEGSNIQLVCLTLCDHGKIYWTLDNKSLNESLSKTVNSTHTVLSLRNVTNHSATVQCHSKDTDQVLGGTTIKTYSKPSNISCFLHYENQETRGVPDTFTCKWEHWTKPKVEINYTVLSVSPLDFTSQSKICTSHETMCKTEYKNIAHKIPLFGNSSVVVRAKSAAWEASSEPYTFKSSNRLKITPPKLNVTAMSDHLLVEWNILSRTQKIYNCQVKYSEGSLNKTLNHKEKGKEEIKKVKSCTNYTVAVRCALEQALWSDWSQERTVLTKLNKRDVKLHLWRKVGKTEENGVRKVYVMWKDIPSTCQETFTYTVTQTPVKEHMAGGDTDGLCSNSVCVVDQDAHRINLTVFHKELLFSEDSVYVPAVGESLPQVTDIHTSTSDGVILVRWRAPVQPVSGYMIDYTHNGNQYYWKEATSTNATLFGLLDKKPYNITVTPLFGDKMTGHGMDALQICSRIGDPGNVTVVNIHIKHRSAFVSWNMKSQEACSGDVISYTVFYREYPSHKGPPLNVTVDSTAQSILLENLNPETQYSVYVQATALTGATKSTEKVFKTKRFDPRFIVAFSVCGGVLIVLVLSLGLCCATQWKKFKEKPVPNPGRSSVASWPSTSREKGDCHFPPFNNPSESLCDRVVTEETLQTCTSPLAAGNNNYQVSERPRGYADCVIVPGPQDEEPSEPAEIQHPSSPGESTELLSSDSPSSPYRSQSFVEAPAIKSNKPCKRFPVRQEKGSPLSVYVTLDMFEQGQRR